MGLARSIAGLFSQLRRCFSRSRAGDPRHALGREGERLARRHLRRHGYKILYRNFRAPRGGEVDIVCRDRACGSLVFVEVKARRGTAHGTPAEAVDLEKQKLIARGAIAWLRMLDNPEINYRFDIVSVLLSDEHFEIEIIKDAFPLPAPYF